MTGILLFLIFTIIFLFIGKKRKWKMLRYIVKIKPSKFNLMKFKISLINLIQFVVFFIIFFWPLIFWIVYWLKFGYVPKMTEEDLSHLPRLSFLKYSISNWWDIFIWWTIIILSLSIDNLSLRYKNVKENISRWLLYLIFTICFFMFWVGSIYALAFFVSFILMYFIIVVIFYILKYIGVFDFDID